MLTAVEGIFRNGRVELRETPKNIEEARVVVTFLGGDRRTPGRERVDPGAGTRAHDCPGEVGLGAPSGG